jgi:hypothetical protein
MLSCARCSPVWLVLAVLCVPAVAAAQTTIYPVVITSQDGLDKHASLLEGAARDAIEASPDYSLGNAEQVMFGIPAGAYDFRQEARALFEEAQADYAEFEFEPAVEKLELALGKLEEGAAYLEDLTLATNILYYLGVIHMFNMEEKKSNEAFLRAYVLAPESEPDPTIFNPEMIQMFKDATAQVFSLGTGSLSISSEPSASRVYLDGRYMGVTPLSIDNVVAGKHFVRIVHPGFQYWGTVAEVQSGQTRTLDAKLFPAYNASKIFTMAEGLPALLSKGIDVANPSLKGMADQLGVEQLLIIWITSADATSVSATWLVYDKPSGAMIAQRQGDSLPVQDGALSMMGDELTRNTLAAGLQADAMGGTGEITVIGPPVTGEGGETGVGTGDGTEPSDKDGIVKKWWFWVALVGGAAAIGGATAAGVCLGTDACQAEGPGGPGGTGDIILEF